MELGVEFFKKVNPKLKVCAFLNRSSMEIWSRFFKWLNLDESFFVSLEPKFEGFLSEIP